MNHFRNYGVEDEPKSVEQLAALTKTNAPALFRLLRTLAGIGIFSEDESQQFSLTPLAEPLRSGIPGSVRTSILSITGDLFIIPWSKLLYSVQTGQPSFDKHFGAPFFDYLTAVREEAALVSRHAHRLQLPGCPRRCRRL